jgi:hypothetical protein
MRDRVRRRVASAPAVSVAVAAVLSLLVLGGRDGGLAPEGGARGCIRLRCGRFLCPPGVPPPDLSRAPPPAPRGGACPRGGAGPGSRVG